MPKVISKEDIPNNSLGVVVGRFCPLHLGHQRLIQTAIDECGLENTLVIIGSENVIDDRTPFSPVDRATWIYQCFPDIRLTWMKDYEYIMEWQDKMAKAVMCASKYLPSEVNYVFYTGSLDDVKWLSEDALVRVVGRDTLGYNESATKVRSRLVSGLPIDDLVPSEIIPDVESAWKKYTSRGK